MSWIPTVDAEQREMLQCIGVERLDDLFHSIPLSLRMKSWNLPAGISEWSVRRKLSAMAGRNRHETVSFIGGGYYDHYVPAAVDAIASRSEFYTAYTPYQPECAQGTLQSIYEYQSAICRLTDMECANASLYDGATAIFEAATMAARITQRARIVTDGSLNPIWRDVLITHSARLNMSIASFQAAMPPDAACLIVQNPSYMGSLNDFSQMAAACHAAGSLLIVVFNPLSLGLVKTPGAMNADIAVAEGQGLGLPLGFGGPYLGILATKKIHIRKMPGRIAAATTDSCNRRGYVLTLQAREQHIRREKALSNICSNQALCALRALVYLSLLGPNGLRDTARACHAKAAYLRKRLDFLLCLTDGPIFNEFAVRLPITVSEVIERIRPFGFLPGLPMTVFDKDRDHDMLIAVTEKHTREQLDDYSRALKDACHG